MNYALILAQIKSLHWCMTTDAYKGMIRLLESGLSEADYNIFHHADKLTLENLISNAGERIEALDYSYKSGNVGTILMDGPIVPRAHNFSRMSGILSVNGLVRDFKALENSPEIDTIVLLHDSPGGSTTGTSEFASLVNASSKKTISFAYGMSCSADYWIGAAADEFYAVDTAVIGSIGTIITLDNSEDDDITITSDQSPLKNADPNTDEGKEQYQSLANGLTDIFIGAVSRYRNVSEDAVKKDFGRGGIMVAAQAASVGMIDGVTTYENLMHDLKNKSFNPAIAGKGKTMNLTEFLAENPAAKAQYDAEMQARFDAGKTEGIEAQKAKIKEASALAEPVLKKGSPYGDKMRSVALKTVMGECSLETFEIALTVHESLTTDKQIEQTNQESQEAGETISPKPKKGENKGISSKADALKRANEIRVSRGQEPLAEEV